MMSTVERSKALAAEGEAERLPLRAWTSAGAAGRPASRRQAP